MGGESVHLIERPFGGKEQISRSDRSITVVSGPYMLAITAGSGSDSGFLDSSLLRSTALNGASSQFLADFLSNLGVVVTCTGTSGVWTRGLLTTRCTRP
jgi:hypothetical protein